VAATPKTSADKTSKLAAVTSKLRQVNPTAAKQSAQSGLGGAKDVMQMAVSYAKQETLDPIKGAARYLGVGLAAAFLFGTGLVLVALGALRGIQTLTGANDLDGHGHFGGNWTWVPYLLAVVVCGAIIGVIVTAMKRSISTGGTTR
jgi:hypothetical protein